MPGLLHAFCWCGRVQFKVAAELVRRGQTVSCGVAVCRPERVAEARLPVDRGYYRSSDRKRVS